MEILVVSAPESMERRLRDAFVVDDRMRFVGRQQIWGRGLSDTDVLLLCAKAPFGAVHWCSVVRRALRGKPLVVACDSAQSRDVARVLDAGANDVVRSTMCDAEIVARVRAVGRAGGRREVPPVTFGPISIDRAARLATLRGEPLDLRGTEFRLLTHLAVHGERVVHHDELTENVLQRVARGETLALRVHVSHLRRKLDSAAVRIDTVRGVGYRLTRARVPSK